MNYISMELFFKLVSLDFIVLSEAIKKIKQMSTERQEAGWWAGRDGAFSHLPFHAFIQSAAHRLSKTRIFRKWRELIGQRRWSDTGELPLKEKYLDLSPTLLLLSSGWPKRRRKLRQLSSKTRRKKKLDTCWYGQSWAKEEWSNNKHEWDLPSLLLLTFPFFKKIPLEMHSR